jgi:thymidylate synthase
MKPQKHYNGERGYLQLLKDIYNYGCDIPDDRTGVGRRKLVNCTLTYDLRESHPAPTVRNTPPDIAIREFWAFINGRPDIHNYLKEFGITIWEGNTTREFLDGRGLHDLPVGHGGKSYGFQYCNFNGEYDENYMPVGGVNQIEQTYNELKNNCFSSRLVTSIWNPNQEKEMALPPCWWNHQFVVTIENGVKVLNLHVTGRSCDVLFGTPFNIQQFSYYLAAMAKAQGMVAGELMATLVDAHIYGGLDDVDKPVEDTNRASQIKYVLETLEREIYEDQVTLNITKELNTFEDLLALTPDDFVLDGHRVNKSKYINKRPTMAV